MGLVQTKRKKSLAALVAAMMGGLLALPIFLASPAAAQTARPLTPACQNAPEHTFADEALLGAEGSEVEEASECLRAYGITTGDNAGNYNPNSRTSREQMASFIARKVKRLTTPPTVTPGNKFANEGISAVHRPNVEYIAATNPAITVGYSDGKFRALRGVARDEMATFIVRQLRVAGAAVPAPSGAQFPDVDPNSPHADNIRIVRQLGIAQGDAQGNFNPKQIVSRAQMALFIARDLAYLVEQLKLTPVGPGQGGTNVTSLPELQSARVVSTTATGVNAGTVVEYLFDEEVRVPNAPSFWVITANNARTNNGAVVTQSNANAVHIRFPGITTTAGAEALTLATVDQNAVQDTTGGGNPEGDAGLGATGGQALAAGVTQAPDLTSISATFAVATATQTFVDFTFDEAATNPGGVGAGGYFLVRLTGQPADIQGTLDSGNGTTTHRVVFNNVDFAGSATTPLTAASFARGFVAAGTVRSATNVLNPLQAAPISANGNSGTPDIASVAIVQDVTDPATGNPIDVALVTFDENVATPTAANLFAAYLANGTSVTPLATTGPTSTSPQQVGLVFADGALATAVGVNVQAGAVASTTGPTPGATNRPDEEGAANTTPTGSAGRTNGPDLLTVVRRGGTDQFGAQTGGSVFRFTFDEAIRTPLLDVTRFAIFLADGTEFTFSGTQCARVSTPAVPGSAGTAPGNTQVDCTFPAGGTNPTNAQMSSATLATVDNGAVASQDVDAGQNNEAGRAITNAL